MCGKGDRPHEKGMRYRISETRRTSRVESPLNGRFRND